MEDERNLETEKAEIIRVEYERPKLIHRVLANFIDILLMVFVTILCFIGARAIVQSTSMYHNNDYNLRKIQLSSHLYINADRTSDSPVDERGFDVNEYKHGDYVILYTSWLAKQESLTGEAKVSRSEKAINNFIAYMDTINHSLAEDITTFVNTKKLEKTGNYVGHEHYFEKDDNTNEIIIPKDENDNPYYSYQTYFKEFYRKIIDDDLIDNYLAKYVTDMKKCFKNEWNYLVFMELLPAYCLGAILVYFIPPLFIKRGRKTLGKALYHIGLVDKNVFSPTFARYLSRFAIFFFAELVLSIFTFAIPYIISFTLMVFSKKQQGFPDYMLGLQEIDTSKQKIYYNKIDALMEKAKVNKAAKDFKLPDTF